MSATEHSGRGLGPKQPFLDGYAKVAGCERIRDGAAHAGPWRERVLAHLQQVVEEKLQGSNPDFN